MMTEETNDAVLIKWENRLAKEILEYARHTLMLDLRYLDAALHRLKSFILPGQLMTTDGNALGFDPVRVLSVYKKEQNLIARTYLHTILHCVFHHVFQASAMDRTLWDLSCDIAVEYVISSLGSPAVRCSCEAGQKEVYDTLEKEIKQVTAERIYRYFRDLPLSKSEAEQLQRLFHADEHFAWYRSEPLQASEKRAGGNQGGRYQVKNEKGKLTEGGSQNSKSQQNQNETDQVPEDDNSNDPATDWEEISRRMQTELETVGRKKGRRSGAMLQTLKSLHREQYDYTSFLRKFSVIGEHLKINSDEFDYIFYTYGLKKYGNLPLIEPLEYSEDRHVREFVIAIDTSGSVRGSLVQAFIQKTFNILKNTESFASRVNVHIIQCDREIREHVKITTLDEFDRYIRSMTLKGFGGTDFRPVFSYVNEMIEKKEFTDLRGLIYFTDGQGDFPRQKPPYETAFVFLDQADNNLRIPPWAMQLILEHEELIAS